MENKTICLNKTIGQKYRNLVHIKDIVDINIRLLNKFEKFPTYQLLLIACEKSEKIIDIIRNIIKYVNSKSKIKLTENCYYNTTDAFWNISHSKKLLGYNPLTIEEGLKLYIKEMEEIK
jgi:nucleoside-diphosphate-sugar epimerase